MYLFKAGGAVLSEGYQMMVNESVEQSKGVADKYIEQCKAKNVSSSNSCYLASLYNEILTAHIRILRKY